MSLETYNDLVAAVSAWLVRSDLDERVPDFIRLAEVRMNQDLRCREMRTTVTLYGQSDTARIELPDDYIDMVSIRPSATWELDGNNQRVLTSMPGYLALVPSSLDSVTSIAYPSAVPGSYALTADLGAIVLSAVGQYAYETTYISDLPALGTDNPTNRVLTRYPDLYLSGTLLEAEIYLMLEPGARGPWADRFNNIVQSLNSRDNRAALGGGSLRTKGPPKCL